MNEQSFAEKLNAAKIYPDFVLRRADNDEVLDGKLDSHGISEFGCYAQHPLEDADIYILSVDGRQAKWNGDKWCDSR